jgi:hypothetical protein
MNTDSVCDITYNTIVSITYKSIHASNLLSRVLSRSRSLSFFRTLTRLRVFYILYLRFSLSLSSLFAPFYSPPPLSLLLSSFKHILHRIFHCVTGWWPVVTRTVVSVATMISLDHLVPPPP